MGLEEELEAGATRKRGLPKRPGSLAATSNLQLGHSTGGRTKGLSSFSTVAPMLELDSTPKSLAPATPTQCEVQAEIRDGITGTVKNQSYNETQ